MPINPYAAGRNIHGRYGRVFRNGVWLATVTAVTYSVAIDHAEVRRAGSKWVDYKEGDFTGSGSLTLDKVNSSWETEFINYINGRDINGTPLTDRTMQSWTLEVTLEDTQTPGIVFDANDFAVSGHESVILENVKFWDLAGGYGDSMISKDYGFTFAGIDLGSAIVDPVILPPR